MLRWTIPLIALIPIAAGCSGGQSMARNDQPVSFAGRVNNWLAGPTTQVAGNPNAAAGTGPVVVDPKIAAEYQKQVEGLAKQLNQLNGQLGKYNTDNHDLYGQIALLERKLQLANDYNFQLKQQLSDTANQIETLTADRNRVSQQFASAQQALESSRKTPATLAGSATIRANNGLMAKLPKLQLDGVKTRMDGDVIRIEIPSEKLFIPNSYQIESSHAVLLNQLASVIRSQFSEQIVGVEAHWDNTQVQGSATSTHQVTATQSVAVFTHLANAGIPTGQMFTMALANNRPYYEGQNAAQNRRVEIVIYPESYIDR